MTRYAYLVLRIPADQLDNFVNGLKDTTNVRSFSENTEDVTLQYIDMDTHIRALREELDALFTMMEQADSMTDILSIQSQITDVRYVYTRWNDNLYRMGQGFQNFLIGFLGGLPILVPVVIVCVAAFMVVRRILRKRKDRKKGKQKSDSEKM